MHSQELSALNKHRARSELQRERGGSQQLASFGCCGTSPLCRKREGEGPKGSPVSALPAWGWGGQQFAQASEGEIQRLRLSLVPVEASWHGRKLWGRGLGRLAVFCKRESRIPDSAAQALACVQGRRGVVFTTTRPPVGKTQEGRLLGEAARRLQVSSRWALLQP